MSRIARKEAVPMGELVQLFIKMNGLSRGVDSQCVFKAWDRASGASGYTLRKFYRDGKLYVTVSSSVIRSQLAFQKQLLIEKMNTILSGDGLFSGEAEGKYIKDLILK